MEVFECADRRRERSLLTVLSLLVVLVGVGDASLQIFPPSLLLPSPLSPASFNFSCRDVQEGAGPQRPTGHIEWLKDGQLLVTEGTKKYRQYRKKGLLEINDIGCDDQGVYECRYNNSRTGDSGRTELWISPEVSNVPLIQTVIVGTLVTVRCDVTCEENDIITWTRNGGLIASSNGTSLRSRYSVLENGSLLVDPVRHGDSGCYTCSASNPGGRSSANVQLIVTRNGRPTAGSVAASLCVSGNNIWNDNSTTLTPACSLATGPVATTAEGCRVLEDVSRSDHSRAPIETASGEKLFGPVFLQQPAHCVRATAGYTVEIPCVVVGNPAPRVWWTRDNVTITGSGTEQPAVSGNEASRPHFEQDGNNTLRINSVAEDDGGVYECVAENSRGRRSVTTTVGVWGARDVCGCVKGGRRERRKRITQGSEVTSPEMYPWQVLIEYRYRNSNKLCGGILLRPDWLLTAAHCLHAGHRWLDPGDLVIRVGVVNRSSTSEPSQQVLVADYHQPHPEYNTTFQLLVNKVAEYDIALIKLRYPAILNTAVRPVCLPDTNSDPPVGTICHVSGWGHLQHNQGSSPSILHHTFVPLVNYSNCRHEDSYGNAVTRKHLCAGFEEGGPDTCQNDSGGPLVCWRGGRWRVFGVINNGIGCGQKKKYGLYARVVRYNSWIKSVLGIQTS